MKVRVEEFRGAGPTTVPMTNTPTPPRPVDGVAGNGEEAFDDDKTFDPSVEVSTNNKKSLV